MGRAFCVLRRLDVDNSHMDPERTEEGEEVMGQGFTRKRRGDGVEYGYAEYHLDKKTRRENGLLRHDNEQVDEYITDHRRGFARAARIGRILPGCTPICTSIYQHWHVLCRIRPRISWRFKINLISYRLKLY